MDAMFDAAERIGRLLKSRGETIAVAESSTGGLLSASLLAVGGASAYFVGGAVVYTKVARSALLGFSDGDMTGLRPSTEAYAMVLARKVAERHGTVWGLGETGATGPSGNRYGDPAGHCCIGVFGPRLLAATLETGVPDRRGNMDTFGLRALALLEEALSD